MSTGDATRRFTLYEDEGDGYGYEQGASATIELSWDDATGRLSIGARVGEYPNMPTEREIAVVVHDGASGSAVASARRLRYVGEHVTVD